MSLPSRARATAATRATRRREKEAELDLGGRHPRDQPSCPHHLSTALARSGTVAYYPEASRQPGPRLKQLKNPPGRHFERRLRRAANFAPSPPPLPVFPSLASTPRSRAASRPCSLDYAQAPAISAPTERTSNRNGSSARAVASRRPANTSSFTARSTPPRVRPSSPPSVSNPHRLPTCSATRARQGRRSGSSPTRAALTRFIARPRRTRCLEFCLI
jgi:hypothetical protein